jgi:hypothetical protein
MKQNDTQLSHILPNGKIQHVTKHNYIQNKKSGIKQNDTKLNQILLNGIQHYNTRLSDTQYNMIHDIYADRHLWRVLLC